MGRIAQMFDTLARAYGVHLPPWGLPVAFLLIVLALSPWIRQNARTEDARKLMKRAAREKPVDRARLEAEALGLVSGRPDGLVAIAKEALEQGRRDVARQAVDQLRATGKLLPQLRQLERALEPPLPGTADEACIVIERMFGAGMSDEGRARLAQALRKWPNNEDLRELQARVDRGDIPTAPQGEEGV